MANQSSAPIRPSAGRPGTAHQLPNLGQKMLRSKQATVPGFMGNETHLLVMKCDSEPNPHLTQELLVTVLGVVSCVVTLEGNSHLKDVSGMCVRDAEVERCAVQELIFMILAATTKGHDGVRVSDRARPGDESG